MTTAKHPDTSDMPTIHRGVSITYRRDCDDPSLLSATMRCVSGEGRLGFISSADERSFAHAGKLDSRSRFVEHITKMIDAQLADGQAILDSQALPAEHRGVAIAYTLDKYAPGMLVATLQCRDGQQTWVHESHSRILHDDSAARRRHFVKTITRQIDDSPAPIDPLVQLEDAQRLSDSLAEKLEAYTARDEQRANELCLARIERNDARRHRARYELGPGVDLADLHEWATDEWGAEVAAELYPKHHDGVSNLETHQPQAPDGPCEGCGAPLGYTCIECGYAFCTNCWDTEKHREQPCAGTSPHEPVPPCAHCGKPAVCIGGYDAHAELHMSCGTCCMHYNDNDGWCRPIEPSDFTPKQDTRAPATTPVSEQPITADRFATFVSQVARHLSYLGLHVTPDELDPPEHAPAEPTAESILMADCVVNGSPGDTLRTYARRIGHPDAVLPDPRRAAIDWLLTQASRRDQKTTVEVSPGSDPATLERLGLQGGDLTMGPKDTRPTLAPAEPAEPAEPDGFRVGPPDAPIGTDRLQPLPRANLAAWRLRRCATWRKRGARACLALAMNATPSDTAQRPLA